MNIKKLRNACLRALDSIKVAENDDIGVRYGKTDYDESIAVSFSTCHERYICVRISTSKHIGCGIYKSEGDCEIAGADVTQHAAVENIEKLFKEYGCELEYAD